MADRKMNTTNTTMQPLLPATKEVFNAKIICGLILLAATAICTLVPSCLIRRTVKNSNTRRTRRRAWKKHVIGAINCFAGGVFIATGLLHVYVDAEEDVKRGIEKLGIDTEFPFTMLFMLSGVFLLLMIESIADYFAKLQMMNPAVSPLINSTNQRYHDFEIAKNEALPADVNSDVHSDVEEILELELTSSHSNFINPHSALQSIVLAVALSVHSIFEGLALGLQHTVGETYKILLVISLHKLVIACSLGINLGMARVKPWILLTIATIFAFASPIGAFIGAGVSEANSLQHGLAVGILQSLACGTFVYVTFFEILPHEFNKKDCIRTLCFACLLIGFAGVALYTYFGGDADDDGHHHDDQHLVAAHGPH